MHRQDIVCAMSGVTLLASTIAVMMIIHSVVVPHLQQQAHIGSVCTVTHITLITDIVRTRHVTLRSTNEHTHNTHHHLNSSTSHDKEHGYGLMEQPGKQRTHPHPLLDENAPNHAVSRETRRDEAISHEKPRDDTIAGKKASRQIPQTRSPHTTRDFDRARTDEMRRDGMPCKDCIPCIIVIVSYYDLDNIARTGHLKLKGENVAQEAPTSNQCFCFDCHLSTSQNNSEVIFGTSTLMTGQQTSCYFKKSPSEAVPSKLSSSIWHSTGNGGLTLHAILWPTAFFVLGFVGVFFSSLHVIKSREVHVRSIEFNISVSGFRSNIV